MKYRRPIFFTDKQKSEIWDRWQREESMGSIGRGFERASSSIYPLLSRTGGIRPPARRRSRLAAQAASMMLQAANVSAGERVLIHGGAGEVGHWLIQMAIAAGADVIATASGAGLQTVMDLGASKAIDSCTGQIEEVGQVDVVFNLIGSDTQGRSWALHGIGGRLPSIKKSSDTEQVDAINATAKFVFPPPNGAALSAMTEQFQRGALKPLKVAHEFALSDAGEAHEIGETGKSCGKMVLIP